MVSTKECDKVRSFMGLAGYYRRFIAGFSRIAHPITSLQRKERNFSGQRIVRKSSNN
jgi:hypothetical protein